MRGQRPDAPGARSRRVAAWACSSAWACSPSPLRAWYVRNHPWLPLSGQRQHLVRDRSHARSPRATGAGSPAPTARWCSRPDSARISAGARGRPAAPVLGHAVLGAALDLGCARHRRCGPHDRARLAGDRGRPRCARGSWRRSRPALLIACNPLVVGASAALMSEVLYVALVAAFLLLVDVVTTTTRGEAEHLDRCSGSWWPRLRSPAVRGSCLLGVPLVGAGDRPSAVATGAGRAPRGASAARGAAGGALVGGGVGGGRTPGAAVDQRRQPPVRGDTVPGRCTATARVVGHARVPRPPTTRCHPNCARHCHAEARDMFTLGPQLGVPLEAELSSLHLRNALRRMRDDPGASPDHDPVPLGPRPRCADHRLRRPAHLLRRARRRPRGCRSPPPEGRGAPAGRRVPGRAGLATVAARCRAARRGRRPPGSSRPPCWSRRGWC